MSNRTIKNPTGSVGMHFMNLGDRLPVEYTMALGQLNETNWNVIRLAGGHKELQETPDEIYQFFIDVFKGYNGILFSGGTRSLKGENDFGFMITEVAAKIREANSSNQIQILGSFPRTGQPGLVGQSSFMVNEWEAANPTYDRLLMVQKDPTKTLDWNGDLPEYFNAMNIWRKAGAKTGITCYNGGDVSYEEGVLAIKNNHPLFLVRGSGRRCEELVREFQGRPGVWVAELGKPETLRNGLLKFGLLR